RRRGVGRAVPSRRSCRAGRPGAARQKPTGAAGGAVSTVLQRTMFETSRAQEYFDAKELQAQTGQPIFNFAGVVLKELVDNAVDACVTAGRAPEIEIVAELDDDQIQLSVSDNGNGLPPETLSRILNFNTRTSDKAAYRTPTRGAQGNAFKTIV